MKVVRLKEYRVPMAEFKQRMSITENIEAIHYYSNSCKDDQDKEEEVTIEVSE